MLLRSAMVVACVSCLARPAFAGGPMITALSAISAAQTQTITITGSGFGSLAPYTGDSDLIVVNVCPDEKCSTGWEAGYAPDHNTVGLAVLSWKNTQIVLSRFSGDFGGPYTLVDGDKVVFRVFKPGTGQITKKSYCSAVVGAGPAKC